MKLKYSYLAVAVVAALTLSACGSPDSTDTAGAKTITVAVASDITTLQSDAAQTSRTAWEVLNLITEAPFAFRGGDVQYLIADSYSWNDDGTVLTLVIKDGILFSNGDPVTAEDVVFSIENARNGELSGDLYDTIESLSAPDASTVEITFNVADSGSLFNLSGFGVGVIPKDFAGQSEDDFWLKPIGTGPYMVKDRQPGVSFTLEQNPNYRGEKPAAEEIIFIPVEDPNTRLLQLQNGTVDIVGDLSIGQVGAIGGDLEVYSFNSGIAESLTLNTTAAPFNDEHARRAVSLAIDRNSIVQEALSGYGDPVGAILAATFIGDYAPAFGLKYDPAAAKAELAKSAYPDGFEFELSFDSNTDMAIVAQVMQAQLAEVGITVTLASDTRESFAAKREANDWNAYNIDLTVEGDAGVIVQIYAPTNSLYAGDAALADVANAAYAEATANFEDGGRVEVFQDFFTKVAESAVQIGVYSPARIYAASPRLSGVQPVAPADAAIDYRKITFTE